MIAREELGAQFAAAVVCQDDVSGIVRPVSVGGAKTRELAEAFGERRSVRTYAPDPIAPDVLGSVIDAGLAVDREMWTTDDDLRVLILTDHDQVFQPDLATAAAVIVVCGDLEAAVRRHGPHGYRRLLTRAGAVVAACHLAAIRAGLHACPFDGLSPEGAGPVRDLSLFALALGLPEAEGVTHPARRSD